MERWAAVRVLQLLILRRYAYPLIFVLVAFVACSSSDGDAGGPVPELEEFRESQLPSLLGVDDQAPTVAFGELVGRFAEVCMRERGFAISAANLVSQFDGAPEGPTAIEVQRQSMSEAAFTEEFGFGVARSGIENYRGGQDNPLQDFVAGLSELEADALLSAFYGDLSNIQSNEGCLAQATLQAQAELGQDRWQLYGVWAGDIQQRIDSDSRVVTLHQTYASCMASKGYFYATPLEARFAANRRFGDWTSSAQVRNPQAEDHFDGLTEESRVAWERLQEQEVQEARASISCEALIRSDIVAIHVEVEQAWIAENAERIAIDLERLDS